MKNELGGETLGKGTLLRVAQRRAELGRWLGAPRLS